MHIPIGNGWVVTIKGSLLFSCLFSCLAVDVVYVEPETESEEEGLSQGAIIGIAVSSGVAGVAVIVAWIAVVACCCVLGTRKSNRLQVSAHEYKNEMYVRRQCVTLLGHSSLISLFLIHRHHWINTAQL